MQNTIKLALALGLFAILTACSSANPVQVKVPSVDFSVKYNNNSSPHSFAFFPGTQEGDFSTKGTSYLLMEDSAKK
ncbi:MAG: hypothetical protein ACAI44_25095 [Candidatus Sericytochromatia bacterium]